MALIVVVGSLTPPKSLSLRDDDFVGGGFVARDDAAFLVLGAVQAPRSERHESSEARAPRRRPRRSARDY